MLETVQTALDNLDQAPLAGWSAPYADLIGESQRIMEKRRMELAVMPEEFKSLERFASLVEERLQEARDAAHDRYRIRRKQVHETLDSTLFELPLDVLDVSQEVLDELEPFENVGGVMLNHLIDESIFERRFAELEGEPTVELQAALDMIMAADLEQLLAEANSIEDDEEEPEADLPADESATDEAEAADETETSEEEDQPEVVLDAFGQPVVEEAVAEEETPEVTPELVAALTGPTPDGARRDERPERDGQPEFVDEGAEQEFELELRKGKTQRRKDRQKRRQLVLDEASGEVIAKRRRKGSRGSWDEETWDEYDY